MIQAPSRAIPAECTGLIELRRSSIVCCCGPAQKPFWRWREIPGISGLRSASSACYTPGTRNSSFIPMSTVLFPPAGSRLITPAGFDPVLASFSPSRCSSVCFAVSSSPLLNRPFSVASFLFPAIWLCSRNPKPSLPGSDHYSEKTGSSTLNHLSAAPTCAPVSGPLHLSPGHLQPSPGLIGRRPGHLSLARLCSPQPAETDNPIAGYSRGEIRLVAEST